MKIALFLFLIIIFYGSVASASVEIYRSKSNPEHTVQYLDVTNQGQGGCKQFSLDNLNRFVPYRDGDTQTMDRMPILCRDFFAAHFYFNGQIVDDQMDTFAKNAYESRQARQLEKAKSQEQEKVSALIFICGVVVLFIGGVILFLRLVIKLFAGSAQASSLKSTKPNKNLTLDYKDSKSRSVAKKSIWDTEVYKEMLAKHGEPHSNLSETDKERIEKILAIPDMMPHDVDGTLEAWLLRISIWGEISITHTNPESGIRNKVITRERFLSYIGDQTRNENYGVWAAAEDGLNVVRFQRSFDSISGGMVTEELVVSVDLRPDIKQVLKDTRNKK